MFEENEFIELKSKYNEHVTKEIVAFLNTEGGIIYLGVVSAGIGFFIFVNEIK